MEHVFKSLQYLIDLIASGESVPIGEMHGNIAMDFLGMQRHCGIVEVHSEKPAYQSPLKNVLMQYLEIYRLYNALLSFCGLSFEYNYTKG